jgi:hypothetical protein
VQTIDETAHVRDQSGSCGTERNSGLLNRSNRCSGDGFFAGFCSAHYSLRNKGPRGTPAVVKRSTSRPWRIVVLSAGIPPSCKSQPDYALSSAIKSWYKTGTCGCFCGFKRWRATRVQFQKGLSEAQFAVLYGTEDQCREAVMRWRWPSGFVCPVCAGQHHSVVKTRALTSVPPVDGRHQ